MHLGRRTLHNNLRRPRLGEWIQPPLGRFVLLHFCYFHTLCTTAVQNFFLCIKRIRSIFHNQWQIKLLSDEVMVQWNLWQGHRLLVKIDHCIIIVFENCTCNAMSFFCESCLVVGGWRLEKGPAATQHCQWPNDLVNQPPVLRNTFQLMFHYIAIQ